MIKFLAEGRDQDEAMWRIPAGEGFGGRKSRVLSYHQHFIHYPKSWQQGETTREGSNLHNRRKIMPLHEFLNQMVYRRIEIPRANPFPDPSLLEIVH